MAPPGARGSSRIASGAVPSRTASASTLELELEPLPAGITRIWPVTVAPTCGWWWSLTRPVCGSSPPHRLSGASSTSAGAAASPASSGRAASSAVRPERGIAHDPPRHGRLDALAQAAERDLDADVPGAYQAHFAEQVITTPAV